MRLAQYNRKRDFAHTPEPRGTPGRGHGDSFVVQFDGRPQDAYGFQLRDDADGPARRGMLDLLRDGFNHRHKVWIDYDAPSGAHNGVIIRVWLTRQ